MKSRLIIIGAGFSKALADAPLVNEFMKPIYKSALQDELSKKIGRLDYETSFRTVMEYLRKSIEHGFKFLEANGTEIKNRSGEELISTINIEHVCTLLDLNIERPFIPEGIGVDLQSCPIPYMNDMHVHHFEDAKAFIIHKIIETLLPDMLNPRNGLLSSFANFINPDDIIITFNYDLLIEQLLWKKQLWNPIDGYFLGKIDDYLEISPKSIFESQVKVIKLHGSINWQRPSFFDDNMKIFITHPFTHASYFEGIDFKFKVKRITDYHLLDFYLISPTFIKTFRSRHEVDLIKKAFEYTSNCNEIISIGYSFPESDSLTTILLTQISKEIPIKIIDLNAKNISERLVDTYGFNPLKVIPEQSNIADWINNDFKFLEFKNFVREKREIAELIGLNKNSKS